METKAIFSDDRDDKLEHYGVKGMKWGKHKLVDKALNEVGEQADIIYDESGIDRTKSKVYNDRKVVKNARQNAKNFAKAKAARNVSSTHRFVKGAVIDTKASKYGSRKSKGMDRVRKILNAKS